MSVHGRQLRRTWDLEVVTDDDIGRRVARTCRPYEYEELVATRGFGPRTGLVVDVGANIGNHSLYWAMELRARVLAFEPNPTARDILCRNVVRNRLDSSIEVRPEALGSSRGHGAITVPAGNLGAARVTDSTAGDVDVIPLDSLGLDDVAFMKIDVEGSEPEVLRGASLTIARCRPAIWVEVLDRPSRDAVQALLADLDYVRRPIWLGATNALFLPSAVRLTRLLRDPIATIIVARRLTGRLVRRVGGARVEAIRS